jgi:hypothetical protein
MSSSCSWLVLAPKVLQQCTNHLVLVLCRFVWVIEAPQFLLISSRSSITPFYPSKVLQAKKHALTPYSSVVFNLNSHLSPSRSWEHVTKSFIEEKKPLLYKMRNNLALTIWAKHCICPRITFLYCSKTVISCYWRSSRVLVTCAHFQAPRSFRVFFEGR